MNTPSPSPELPQGPSVAAQLGEYPLLAKDLSLFMKASRAVLLPEIEGEDAPADMEPYTTLSPIAFDGQTATIAAVRNFGVDVHLFGTLDDEDKPLEVYASKAEINKLDTFDAFVDEHLINGALLPREFCNITWLQDIISGGQLRYFGFDSAYNYSEPTEAVPGLESADPNVLDHDALVTRACMSATMFAVIERADEYRDVLPIAMRQYELLRQAGQRPLGPEELNGLAAKVTALFFEAYNAHKNAEQDETEPSIESA